MRTLKQSTAYELMVLMVDSTDHVTGKTGLTLTVTASKAGAAFASISPTVTERGSGWYALSLTSSHTDTLGDLALHITGTDADPADVALQVRANVLGDTLPSAVQSVATDAITADAVAADAVTEIQSGLATAANLATVAGYLDTEVAAIKAVTDKVDDTLEDDAGTYRFTTNALEQAPTGSGGGSGLDAAGVRAAIGLASANLDTQLAAIDDVIDTEVAAIKAKTDLIPADPATETTLATLATAAALATIDDFLDTEIAAIKAKTDNLPAAPAATGDIPTANAVADALLDRTNAVETSLTVRQALRLIAAASAGKLSGAGTTTITIRNVGDTADRVTATVDADGNRSAVTVNA